LTLTCLLFLIEFIAENLVSENREQKVVKHRLALITIRKIFWNQFFGFEKFGLISKSSWLNTVYSFSHLFKESGIRLFFLHLSDK